MNDSHAVRLNRSAASLYQQGRDHAQQWRMRCRDSGGCQLIDAGLEVSGSLSAGIWLARLCMADCGVVSMHPAETMREIAEWNVSVRTDHPVAACLASQYAGWPVTHDKYFAMGSGPMRLARGREPMLEHLSLVATAETIGDPLVGILESESLPDAETIAAIADQCDTAVPRLRLAIAPSYSIAGTIQVVARSVETAMHKLHELEFDVQSIVSAAGHAPLPPLAKRGDTVGGIGRTNDAILYGGVVTFWTDADDDAIAEIIDRVPSCASEDHGQPFAKVFKQYDYDFYKVDPMLFSPAVVIMRSIVSGKTFRAGQIETTTLGESFS